MTDSLVPSTSTAGIGTLLVRTGRFTLFLLRCVVSLPGALAYPRQMINQCQRVALGSLPLVLVTAVSVGVVIWLQGRTQMSQYEMEAQLPGLVAVFVVIGIGPVLTGLVVAGQLGAQLAAELASMKVSQQLDALSAMGVSPQRRLVSIRVLSCMLMVPLLTVVLDYAAIGAGAMAEAIGGTLTFEAYTSGVVTYLTLDQVVPATLSSVLFGLLIGVCGCYAGLESGPGTDGVGRASTFGVVGAMLLVLGINVLWVQGSELWRMAY